MVDQPPRTLRELVDHVGRYREEAFLFVRDGLSHAAQRVHGPETSAHRDLHQFIESQELDWGELIQRYHEGDLPEPVVDAIDAVGGCEKLDRHISGRQLCWGLRDYAFKRWGLLARTVLESWRIRKTQDFGRIVFGFIEFNLMQKQQGDTMEDFVDVYSFDDAFSKSLDQIHADDEDDTSD